MLTNDQALDWQKLIEYGDTYSCWSLRPNSKYSASDGFRWSFSFKEVAPAAASTAENSPLPIVHARIHRALTFLKEL
jgi:hypothetical protein